MRNISCDLKQVIFGDFVLEKGWIWFYSGLMSLNNQTMKMFKLLHSS